MRFQMKKILIMGQSAQQYKLWHSAVKPEKKFFISKARRKGRITGLTIGDSTVDYSYNAGNFPAYRWYLQGNSHKSVKLKK
jgi:hypothetical protein